MKETLKLRVSVRRNIQNVEVLDGGNAIEITFTPAEMDLWRDRISLYLNDGEGNYLSDKSIEITKKNKLK